MNTQINLPDVSLAVILNHKGQVLAVSRKDDHSDFGFPGGKLEMINTLIDVQSIYETHIDALIREVKEETGLDISASHTELLLKGQDENSCSCSVFLCEYTQPDDCSYFDPNIIPSKKDETGVVCWMDWDEFISKSKSHKEFNTKVRYQLDFRTDRSPVERFKFYRNQRTDEVYEILHITHDNWVMVRSCFNQRPMIINLNVLNDAVYMIPRVTFVYESDQILLMESKPENFAISQIAKVFAISAHNDAAQLYGEHITIAEHYSKHLCDVVDVFDEFKYLIPSSNHDLVEAGLWCHDVIEDARMTFNDVKMKLGEDVANIAYAMSNEKGKNRKQRANEEYYQGLRSNIYGEFCKLCDRIANVRNGLSKGKMIDGYRKEQAEFKRMLQNNPKFTPMWDCLDAILETKTKI